MFASSLIDLWGLEPDWGSRFVPPSHSQEHFFFLEAKEGCDWLDDGGFAMFWTQRRWGLLKESSRYRETAYCMMVLSELSLFVCKMVESYVHLVVIFRCRAANCYRG